MTYAVRSFLLAIVCTMAVPAGACMAQSASDAVLAVADTDVTGDLGIDAMMPADASPASFLTGAELTARLVHPALLQAGSPGLLASLPAPPDTLEPGVSPLDTLRKSPIEKVFWGRHGLYRVTGLFKTDPDEPVNDIRRMLKVRRKMLSLHQILGLTTVASMTVTVVGGQRAIDGHGSTLHKASLPVTIGLYSTTAALALTAPPKLLRGGGIDTITFHKAFAVLHLAGMILTPMVAPELDEGGEGNKSLHQALGYATYGAFTAGMLTVMLFR